MTMVVWVGCEDFAIVTADKRAKLAKGGTLTRGDDHIVVTDEEGMNIEGFPKIFPSVDGHDVFGFSGLANAHASSMKKLFKREGQAADKIVLAEAEKLANLAEAHTQPKGGGTTNTVMHCYRLDGRNVCRTVDSTPCSLTQIVRTGGATSLEIGAIGSGALYLQWVMAVPTEAARWKVVQETGASDWRIALTYVRRLFRAVHALDDLVGPTVDVWLMQRGEPTWRKLGAEDLGDSPPQLLGFGRPDSPGEDGWT